MAVCRVTEWYDKPLIRLRGLGKPSTRRKARVIAHYNPCRVVGPPLRFGVVEQLDHGAGRNVAGQGFSGVDVVPIRHDPLPNAVGSFDVYICR